MIGSSVVVSGSPMAHDWLLSAGGTRTTTKSWRRGAAATQRASHRGYRYRDGTTRPSGANDEQAQSDARARRPGGAGKMQPIGKQPTECQRDRSLARHTLSFDVYLYLLRKDSHVNSLPGPLPHCFHARSPSSSPLKTKKELIPLSAAAFRLTCSE